MKRWMHGWKEGWMSVAGWSDKCRLSRVKPSGQRCDSCSRLISPEHTPDSSRCREPGVRTISKPGALTAEAAAVKSLNGSHFPCISPHRIKRLCLTGAQPTSELSHESSSSSRSAAACWLRRWQKTVDKTGFFKFSAGAQRTRTKSALKQNNNLPHRGQTANWVLSDEWMKTNWGWRWRQTDTWKGRKD